MRVEIGLPGETSNSTSDLDRPQIYLEGLKGYPDVRCQPEINGALAVFRLSLSDFYECGVTRMVNQLTVGGVAGDPPIVANHRVPVITPLPCCFFRRAKRCITIKSSLNPQAARRLSASSASPQAVRWFIMS